MPVRDLERLVDAARGAADIAGRYWQADPHVWDKAENDPVSEADIAVDIYLRESLLDAFPGHGWLSEETPDTPARLDLGRVIVVDPIDGTRAFVAGKPEWAHSIAVVEDGVPMLAVVLLPALDRLYTAAAGAGATLNGAGLSTGTPAEPIRLLSNKATLAPSHWPNGVPDVDRAFRPSLAYRLCLVADASFDAMATLRDSWEWDIAAGALIAAEAGARVTDAQGAPLRFNNPHPATPGVIAATPRAHEALMKHRGAAE